MIVVAGEALIDLVPEGGQALYPRRGGGPYNTAVALARLGSATAFCSRVSTDAFGESLLAELRTNGVDTGLVQRGPEPTTLAVASLGADGSAGYTFYTEGTADRLFRLPEALPEAARAVSFGTCSLVLEPGATAYERMLRRESARGLFTALDPNIRAGLIPDPDAYRARFRGWLPDVRLLKLSAEDAEWLGGTPRDWLADGPSAVVVTRGGDGLSVHVQEAGEYREYHVPGHKVDVVDTIGAGDTVNAALLHRLAEAGAASGPGTGPGLGGVDWPAVLDFAARAAAVTCSRAGANPPTSAEVASFGERA
ncbi:carbohydrate kinase family protein [Phaeacidiphilus oryzae]|uniref:carbohydrate kinase family protein n=1 Tax=Phaeacidiphilus oryzae TaxID=348818 RepID=UPI00055EF0E0|nr:carbohydrate kinase [Phaeacidiphilus oryzae]